MKQPQKNVYLLVGGYANLMFAVAQIIGLFWIEQMYTLTNMNDEMLILSDISPVLPYALTIMVAFAFAMFGLYGLSGARVFAELPSLKIGIFLIGGIYLVKGIGEYSVGLMQRNITSLSVFYSTVAILVGICYIIGGIQRYGIKNILKW